MTAISLDFMQDKLTVPPIPFISLDDAKTHLRVDIDDDDALIEAIIAAACAYLDGAAAAYSFAIADQTRVVKYYPQYNLRNGANRWQVAHVKEVLQIQYYQNGALIDANLNDWVIAINDTYFEVFPQSGVWPTFDERWDAFHVEYTLGLDPIPNDIIATAKLLISAFYDNRGDVDFKIPAAVDAMVNMRRMGRIR